MTSKLVSLLLSLVVFYGVRAQGLQVEEGYEHLFSSVPDELINSPMNFTGAAPKWLNGSLVRVGPGMFEVGGKHKSKVTSCLDGFAKVAHWKFLGNGSLLFSTRFINSTYYVESNRNQKLTSNIFVSAVYPPLTQYEVERSLQVGMDNMDINIMGCTHTKGENKTVVATTDTWPVYEILLQENLSTGRKLSPPITDTWESSPAFLKQLSTAHPLPEPNTDNLINIILEASLNPQGNNWVKVVRIKSPKQTEVIASWEIEEIPFVHSFAVTENKVIFAANPFLLNVTCMLNNSGDCYYWKTGNENITLYVVDINTGNVQQIPMEKLFVYHYINAYEEIEDKIFVDIASYDSPVAYTKFSLEELKNPVTRQLIEPKAEMKRICVYLGNNSATVFNVPSPTPMSKIASTLDYPAINEAYRSKSYCYVYGIVEKLDGTNIGNMGIAKKDLCSNDGVHKDALYRRTGWYPSEPTFVATPGATEEDDGVLLVPYTSGADKLTHLVVLDAKDLTFIDIAHGPLMIPQSQHGMYFSLL